MVPEREATSMSNQFPVDIPACGFMHTNTNTDVKVILYSYE